jgi:hypothetical protein
MSTRVSPRVVAWRGIQVIGDGLPFQPLDVGDNLKKQREVVTASVGKLGGMLLGGDGNEKAPD